MDGIGCVAQDNCRFVFPARSVTIVDKVALLHGWQRQPFCIDLVEANAV